ncbi:MAG: GatB/YqeY domain-containing protein [Pseudomonadota bacterium]
MDPSSASPAYGWDRSMEIPLRDKIKTDLKNALKAKNNGVRDTLRLLMGEYPSLTVPLTLESGKKSFRLKQFEEMTDDDILGIIQRLVKSEKTVLEIKKSETSEFLQILETYLPRMATAEEIGRWIAGNIDMSAFKSPMQAMGAIMKHFGKQADGNLVKSVLKEMADGGNR